MKTQWEYTGADYMDDSLRIVHQFEAQQICNRDDRRAIAKRNRLLASNRNLNHADANGNAIAMHAVNYRYDGISNLPDFILR